MNWPYEDNGDNMEEPGNEFGKDLEYVNVYLRLKEESLRDTHDQDNEFAHC